MNTYVVNMNAVLGIGEEYRIYRYLAGGCGSEHTSPLPVLRDLVWCAAVVEPPRLTSSHAGAPASRT